MKRSLPMLAVFAASIILFAASCAGTPKPAAPAPVEAAPVAEAEPTPEPSKPAPPPVVVVDTPDQAMVDSLADAKARAEKSRKQAFDVEAPSYFPADWKKAETSYLLGVEKAKVNKAVAYREAAEAYLSAAELYDAAAQRSLPLFADARRAEVVKAREAALKSGIGDISPERLGAADAVAAEAEALYKAGDYYGAAAKAQEARARYVALATGSKAASVKNEIDRRDFAAYDPSNYKLANDKLGAAMSSYDAGAIPASQGSAEEAQLRFNIALVKGKEMNASGYGKRAETQRNAARDLKANVAVKAGFEQAAAVLSEADATFKSERYDESADLYAEAESLFSVVRATAAEKRRIAQEAIDKAAKKLSDSEQTAKEADAVIEGGKK